MQSPLTRWLLRPRVRALVLIVAGALSLLLAGLLLAGSPVLQTDAPVPLALVFVALGIWSLYTAWRSPVWTASER